jgi:hypothetical protein
VLALGVATTVLIMFILVQDGLPSGFCKHPHFLLAFRSSCFRGLRAVGCYAIAANYMMIRPRHYAQGPSQWRADVGGVWRRFAIGRRRRE